MLRLQSIEKRFRNRTTVNANNDHARAATDLGLATRRALLERHPTTPEYQLARFKNMWPRLVATLASAHKQTRLTWRRKQITPTLFELTCLHHVLLGRGVGRDVFSDLLGVRQWPGYAWPNYYQIYGNHFGNELLEGVGGEDAQILFDLFFGDDFRVGR